MPKPLIENLPYPDLSQLTCDECNARIIMPAYADTESELTAILQYIFHSFNFRTCGMTEYADMLEEIAIAEMTHLDMLGEALGRMGITPVFSSVPPRKCDFFSARNINYAVMPAAMLAADITAEKRAICSYEQMLCKLTNPVLHALVSRIILDERMHLQKFENAYREIIA